MREGPTWNRRAIVGRPSLGAETMDSVTLTPATAYSSTARSGSIRMALKRPMVSGIGPRPTSSRLGAGSRVVLTHDVAQRDNLRVGRHDGVAAVIEKLKGHPLFAHITLLRSERSPIAALVTEMLEEISPGALP